MSFNVTFALRIPLFASPPLALMSSFPPFSILTVSAALFPALRPLPAVVVLISKVAPSILRCPEVGITIPYPLAVALVSLIVTFVFAPLTFILPFMYRSPKVPFPLFSIVICAPSNTLKVAPSTSIPPSFPVFAQFLTTNVPPLMLVVFPPNRA